MPGYAKFMKDLLQRKDQSLSRMMIDYRIVVLLLQYLLVQKKEDLGAFTIPCKVGSLHFAKALCDLRQA